MRAGLIVSILVLSAGPACAADPVEGEWIPQDGGSKVRISGCPDKAAELCGVVSWLPAAKTKDLDGKNPDPAKKKRPILGVPVIFGFKQSAPGKWSGGKIYDAASGKTYSGKLSINPNGTLKVEGCVMMICQGQTWKRA
jgi:uncharacterized protein (DUF2147 family)